MLAEIEIAQEIVEFGRLVLVAAGGVMIAILSTKLTDRLRVPAPALFLLAAVLAAELSEPVRGVLSVRDVERIATVALILILFDGGMHVGWGRFKAAGVPIGLLGIAGTFATAGLLAAAAHYLFGFDWIIAWIIGAALAPTDPAVMFSVLGNREVRGRSGTILEGESGTNDPVAIALMVGLIEFATSDAGTVVMIVEEFLIEMAIGLALGLIGGFALRPLMQRVPLPNEGFYALRTLAAAGLIYAAAAVAGGSGFLAVFIAGVLVGDITAPYKARIARFHDSLAGLAEIVVFAALGLTIDLSTLGTDGLWVQGLVLALILAIAVRPLVVGPLLLPARLRPGERLFIMWSGLKGAVPIVLGAFVLLGDVPGGEAVYGIVFVVVAFSVIFQGISMPSAARRLGVPMEEIAHEPWDAGLRFQHEPRSIHRFEVSERSPASGRTIGSLPLGDELWISLLIRDGRPVQAQGDEVLQPGDEVLALGDIDDVSLARALFESPG